VQNSASRRKILRGRASVLECGGKALRHTALDADRAPELELRLTARLAAERSLKRLARSKAAWRKAFPPHSKTLSRLLCGFLRAQELKWRLTALLAAEQSLKCQAGSKAAWRKAFPPHSKTLSRLLSDFLRIC
jgi:hypothetical protein